MDEDHLQKAYLNEIRSNIDKFINHEDMQKLRNYRNVSKQYAYNFHHRAQQAWKYID